MRDDFRLEDSKRTWNYHTKIHGTQQLILMIPSGQDIAIANSSIDCFLEMSVPGTPLQSHVR